MLSMSIWLLISDEIDMVECVLSTNLIVDFFIVFLCPIKIGILLLKVLEVEESTDSVVEFVIVVHPNLIINENQYFYNS